MTLTLFDLDVGGLVDNREEGSSKGNARSRRLVLFAVLAIAAILTTITAEYPSRGSWQLPGICLAAYATTLLLLLAVPLPGLGSGFAIATSALLAAGSGLLAFQICALAQAEVSTAQDRQTIWLAAVACLANLSLTIAALRYMLAVKQRLRSWHVALGVALAVLPAWILMSRLV